MYTQMFLCGILSSNGLASVGEGFCRILLCDTTQEDIFAADDMCVILAAANAVHQSNPAEAKQLMDSAPTGRQSFNSVADFLQNTTGIRTENIEQ
jgi:hypothetical protein